MDRTNLSNYVETFLEMITVERGAAQNTIDSYRRDLCDFNEFCVARKRLIENADSNLIRGYVKKLSNAAKGFKALASPFESNLPCREPNKIIPANAAEPPVE